MTDAEFQTERLVLRPLSIDDAQTMSDLPDGDQETVGTTEKLHYPFTPEAARG